MYLTRPSLLVRKIYSKAVWKINTSEKKIFLTFDDGPAPEATPWVLNTLKKYNAKATFFCVGDNVKKNPDIYDRIISEGYLTGNHTYNHLRGWTTSTSTYIENVEKCSALVSSKLFRPPYGKLSYSQFKILHSKFSIIMWDVLSADFDKNLSKEKCLKKTIQNTREGSIVLFHDSLKASENLYYTLPKYLQHFSEQGYVFESLDVLTRHSERSEESFIPQK